MSTWGTPLSPVKAVVKRTVLRSFGVMDRLPPAAGRSVLLTFDDGPHATVTDRVLERLAAHDALAVFFVVGGRMAAAPDVLSRITAQGHVLGNHTYLHSLDRQPGWRSYLADLKRCQAAIADCVGQPPRLFRPALGRFTPGSLVTPKLLGLTTLYWSVDSFDWRLRDRRDAIAVGQRLARQIRPRDIVLFHDDNLFVVDVLDVVLPALVRQQYDLQTAVHDLKGPGPGAVTGGSDREG